MKKRFNKLAILFVCLFCVSFSSCNVKSDEVKVSDFNFKLTTSSITVGYSCMITDVYIFPDHATNKSVEYWIEDPTIASISGESITGLIPGNTKVWGKTLDGSDIRYSVPLTVNDVPDVLVTSIQLAIDPTTRTVGDVFTPTIAVLPSNATNKEVELIASNDNVSISPDGRITCEKAGTTTLKAKAKDKSGVESSTITLTIKNAVTTGIIARAGKTSLNVGAATKINLVFTPATTVDREVSYRTASGTESVVSVTSAGYVVGKGEGKDKVIIELVSNPNVKAEIEFTVSTVEPTSVKINLPTTVYAGDIYNAGVTVLPIAAYDTTPVFSITNGNDVATITEDGRLIVLKTGTFTVHVYLKEKTTVTSDLNITAVTGNNPSDPHKDDIYEGV